MMTQIKLMINGIPGKMASATAIQAIEDKRVELMPFSFTSIKTKEKYNVIGKTSIKLIKPSERYREIKKIKKTIKTFISVDYTNTSVVNQNTIFYCDNCLPFVMGTTVGNHEKFKEKISNSTISVVTAPNMAKEVVIFNAMMEYCANNFPNIFKNHFLNITESHQKTKVATSATAETILSHLKKIGLQYSSDDITKIRDPNIQKCELKIPEEHINGHGWHSYSLTSKDKTVLLRFEHNINGRNAYAKGTIDAVCFLSKQIELGRTGQIFSMTDVLRN